MRTHTNSASEGRHGADPPRSEGVGTSDRRWLVADQLGSIVAVTNGAGTATTINSYDAFGRPGPSNAGRFQYTGQAILPEVALYHYKARAYQPALGRFLQTDPILYGGGLNLYAYVANDPLNASDPSGQFGIPGAVFGGIVGGFSGWISGGGKFEDIAAGVFTGALTGFAGGNLLRGAGEIGQFATGVLSSAVSDLAVQVSNSGTFTANPLQYLGAGLGGLKAVTGILNDLVSIGRTLGRGLGGPLTRAEMRSIPGEVDTRAVSQGLAGGLSELFGRSLQSSLNFPTPTLRWPFSPADNADRRAVLSPLPGVPGTAIPDSTPLGPIADFPTQGPIRPTDFVPGIIPPPGRMIPPGTPGVRIGQ